MKVHEPPTLDPFAPEVREDPYPVYHRLRETDPVHETEEGSLILTRYHDVAEALRDPRLSSDHTRSNRFRTGGRLSFAGNRDFLQPPAGAERMLGTIMLFADPPDHTRLRNLVSKAFTARAVEALRPRVEQIVGKVQKRSNEP